MTRQTPAARALGLTLAASAAHAQPAAPRAFVVRHGRDTLAVERVERVERGPDGAVVSRLTFRGGGLPPGVRAVTTYTLAPNGGVRRTTTDASVAGATTPPPRVTVTFGTAPGDSIEVQIGTAAPQRVPAAPDVLPYTNLSVVPWELALRQALALGGGTLRPTEVAFFAGPRVPTLRASVTPHGRDSVVFTATGFELRARITGDGHILGMRVPAQDIEIEAADPRAAPFPGVAYPASPAGSGPTTGRAAPLPKAARRVL